MHDDSKLGTLFIGAGFILILLFGILIYKGITNDIVRNTISLTK